MSKSLLVSMLTFSFFGPSADAQAQVPSDGNITCAMSIRDVRERIPAFKAEARL